MVKIKDGRTVEVGDKVILTSLSGINNEELLSEGHMPTVKITKVSSKAIGGRSFVFEPPINDLSYFSEELGDRFEFVEDLELTVNGLTIEDLASIKEVSDGDTLTVYQVFNGYGDLVTLNKPKQVVVEKTDGNYAILDREVGGVTAIGCDDIFTIDSKKRKGKVVYSGGHILNEAFVEYRDKQHDQLAAIDGIEPYSPHKDASINDKSIAEQTGLAERILANDFKAMQESDVFVFDVLNEGLGTIAEMGIVLGMKHQAQKVIDELIEIESSVGYLDDAEVALFAEQLLILNKPVFCYCSDIRQGNGHIPEHPDRFEFSTNQFVYGCVKSLTNGEGFISWNEVLERLEEIDSRNR